MENIEIDMKNVDGGLKIVKVRDVVAKLVYEMGNPVILDDEEVNDLIEDLMSKDMIDKEGNKRQSTGIGSGNTVIKILDNHFEKFTEAMKRVPPQKLQEMKEQIRNAIQENPLLGTNLEDIGIDLDNFENYLGSVEVLTVERRSVYNVYEVKKDDNI